MGPVKSSDLRERSTAVVTGAGRGIGAAIAAALGGAGHQVAVLDIDPQTAGATAEAVADSGVSAIGYRCDVADEDSVGQTIAQVATQLGAPSILVNNAAIGVYAPIDELTREQWTRMLAVNLIGPFLTTQALLRHLPASGGAIVNITSVGAHLGNPMGSAYAASKGGLISFTRTAAVELAPRCIRVNAISPGPIDTLMTAQLSDAATNRRRLTRVPLARLGQASEIASAVAFLASGAASFITGQVLCVDGGWTAQSL